MADILDEGGITDVYLQRKLKRELNAKETKVFNNKGEIVCSKPMIAWEIRQRARQDAHKLRGDYPAEEHRITGEFTQTRTPEELDELKAIAQSVAENIRKRPKK